MLKSSLTVWWVSNRSGLTRWPCRCRFVKYMKIPWNTQKQHADILKYTQTTWRYPEIYNHYMNIPWNTRYINKPWYTQRLFEYTLKYTDCIMIPWNTQTTWRYPEIDYMKIPWNTQTIRKYSADEQVWGSPGIHSLFNSIVQHYTKVINNKWSLQKLPCGQ